MSPEGPVMPPKKTTTTKKTTTSSKPSGTGSSKPAVRKTAAAKPGAKDKKSEAPAEKEGK